jgi:hypothetical protein
VPNIARSCGSKEVKKKKKPRFSKNTTKPGMVLHFCNPSIQELRQEDHEFEASLTYIASFRPAWATQ